MMPMLAHARIRTAVKIPIQVDSGVWLPATMLSFHSLSDSDEHFAVIFNEPLGKTPAVRIHSECMTGDVFGSGRCDCGPQLREAVRTLSKTGGVILYLRQEGRGIGLYNKFDAYQLQERGLDTYEANIELEFAGDMRDYLVAAEMLHALDLQSIRLMTNNPDKVAQLTEYGIEVKELIPTGTFVTETNRHYLETKVKKAGHEINFPQEFA